jgi:hypothetical protein
MFDSIQPVMPYIPETEQERHDRELWDAITTAVQACGYRGGDVTQKSIEVLKGIVRYDMLPPFERKGGT